MVSEMPVFARFPAFCLGFAPPVAPRRAADRQPGPRTRVARSVRCDIPAPRSPLSRPATRLGCTASASTPPSNAARTGSRLSVPSAVAAPPRQGRAGQGGAGRGRAGATGLSSQSQWACWLLVSAVLGDSVLLGAIPMEDMDLVILTEIRSSCLIVFPCL